MIQAKHDIALFVGAGFSAAAGLPVMSQFGSFSEDRLRHVNELTIGSSEDGFRRGASLLAEAGRTWQLLRDHCKSRVPNSLLDSNNIEDLYSFVDALKDRGGPIVELGGEHVSVDYVATMVAIWVWVVYHYCPIASTKEKEKWAECREPYVKLATRLAQDELYNRVLVITTNYDLIFETLLLHETSTLRLDADSGQSERCSITVDIDDKSIDEVRKKIPICKLHGSVDLFTLDTPLTSWIEPGHDGQPAPTVHTDSIRQLVHANRLDRTHHAQGRLAVLQMNSLLKLRRQHSERLMPAIAPPTFAKSNRFEWLSKTWHQAYQALLQVKHIIFIGYSMPPSDGHLQGLFSTAFANRKSPLPSIRVLDSNDDVLYRYKRLFDIKDDRLTHCSRFESPSAIAKVANWLDDITST